MVYKHVFSISFEYNTYQFCAKFNSLVKIKYLFRIIIDNKLFKKLIINNLD
jgi:hypothetical protein